MTPATPDVLARPAATNTLLSSGPARGTGGMIQAIIASAARPAYTLTFSTSGRGTLRLHGAGQAVGRTVFDVASGQLLSSTASYTISLDQQLRDRRGGVRTAHTRIVWTMSFQRM